METFLWYFSSADIYLLHVFKKYELHMEPTFKKTLFLLNLIYSYIFLFSYTFHTQRIDEIMKRTRKSDASLEVKVGIQITIMSWVKKSRIHLVILKVWDKCLEKVDLFSSVQDKTQDGTETWKEREISEMKKVKDSLREVG